MSPILFNAFINDLQFLSDDAPEINVMITTMQKWCDDNELQLNTDKTQIMTITKTTSVIRHPNHLPQIKILGVILEDKLKWNTH